MKDNNIGKLCSHKVDILFSHKQIVMVQNCVEQKIYTFLFHVLNESEDEWVQFSGCLQFWNYFHKLK